MEDWRDSFFSAKKESTSFFGGGGPKTSGGMVVTVRQYHVNISQLVLFIFLCRFHLLAFKAKESALTITTNGIFLDGQV